MSYIQWMKIRKIDKRSKTLLYNCCDYSSIGFLVKNFFSNSVDLMKDLPELCVQGISFQSFLFQTSTQSSFPPLFDGLPILQGRLKGMVPPLLYRQAFSSILSLTPIIQRLNANRVEKTLCFLIWLLYWENHLIEKYNLIELKEP